MTKILDNTLTAYLGHEFQERLMWQLLVEPEFAEKTIPNISVEYFDDPNYKRLFIIILEFFKEYDKVPNLQNKSIHQAIHRYKTPNNYVEEESLFSLIRKIEKWNQDIINKNMLYDGDVIQKATVTFIKQQEYRKLGESITDKVRNGDIRSKYTVSAIEEKFQKITNIGDEEDDCDDIGDGIERALRKEFRETIPTGIGAIDALTGGGLGKGEFGLILAPSGVGKTTALTKIANTAYLDERNVAHVIFEDTKDQVKRKHYVIWADSALSKLDDDDERERVAKIASEKTLHMEGRGRLVIKKFSQEDTTIKDIKNWMINHQKKFGFKFDILVLDYLDCIESHKKTPDRNEAELAVVKGFEAMASDFNIPCWTAIQSNRSGIGAEFVDASQSGGSIKRMQKAHFFMSIAKTPAQQEANFANISILKARFAKDGQMFEDCIFNNDTMKIIIDDPKYKYTKTYKNLKHHDTEDIDKLEKKAEGLSKMHVALSQQSELGTYESNKINEMLRQNLAPEEDVDENKPPENIIEEEIETIDVETKKETDTELLDIGGDDNVKVIEYNNDDITPSTTFDDNSFDWNGESGSTINNVENIEEVKFEEPPEEIVDKVSEIKIKLEINESPPNEDIPIFTGKSTNYIMNELMATDLDEPEGEYKSVYDMLTKKREHQHVKKK